MWNFREFFLKCLASAYYCKYMKSVSEQGLSPIHLPRASPRVIMKIPRKTSAIGRTVQQEVFSRSSRISVPWQIGSRVEVSIILSYTLHIHGCHAAQHLI
jgi:hypothetical protein